MNVRFCCFPFLSFFFPFRTALLVRAVVLPHKGPGACTMTYLPNACSDHYRRSSIRPDRWSPDPPSPHFPTPVAASRDPPSPWKHAPPAFYRHRPMEFAFPLLLREEELRAAARSAGAARLSDPAQRRARVFGADGRAPDPAARTRARSAPHSSSDLVHDAYCARRAEYLRADPSADPTGWARAAGPGTVREPPVPLCDGRARPAQVPAQGVGAERRSRTATCRLDPARGGDGPLAPSAGPPPPPGPVPGCRTRARSAPQSRAEPERVFAPQPESEWRRIAPQWRSERGRPWDGPARTAAPAVIPRAHAHAPPRPSAGPARDAHAPPRPSAGPARDAHAPLRPSAGPARDAHAPPRPSAGPARDAHAPLRPSAGPARDAHAPPRPSAGPARDAHAPPRPSAGPARDAHAPLRPSAGPARDAHAPPRPSAGPARDAHAPPRREPRGHADRLPRRPSVGRTERAPAPAPRPRSLPPPHTAQRVRSERVCERSTAAARAKQEPAPLQWSGMWQGSLRAAVEGAADSRRAGWTPPTADSGRYPWPLAPTPARTRSPGRAAPPRDPAPAAPRSAPNRSPTRRPPRSHSSPPAHATSPTVHRHRRGTRAETDPKPRPRGTPTKSLAAPQRRRTADDAPPGPPPHPPPATHGSTAPSWPPDPPQTAPWSPGHSHPSATEHPPAFGYPPPSSPTAAPDPPAAPRASLSALLEELPLTASDEFLPPARGAAPAAYPPARDLADAATVPSPGRAGDVGGWGDDVPEPHPAPDPEEMRRAQLSRVPELAMDAFDARTDSPFGSQSGAADTIARTGRQSLDADTVAALGGGRAGTRTPEGDPLRDAGPEGTDRGTIRRGMFSGTMVFDEDTVEGTAQRTGLSLDADTARAPGGSPTGPSREGTPVEAGSRAGSQALDVDAVRGTQRTTIRRGESSGVMLMDEDTVERKERRGVADWLEDDTVYEYY